MSESGLHRLTIRARRLCAIESLMRTARGVRLAVLVRVWCRELAR
jgi:hypothetical protein